MHNACKFFLQLVQLSLPSDCKFAMSDWRVGIVSEKGRDVSL